MASQPARARAQNTRQEWYPNVLDRQRGADGDGDDDDDDDDDEQRVKRARWTTDDPAQAPSAVRGTEPRMIEPPEREKGERRRARVPVERALANEAGRKRRRTLRGDPPVAGDAVVAERKGDSEDGSEDDGPAAIVRFWVREGRWPGDLFQACPDLASVTRSSPSFDRTRPSSASSVTPSDQRPREEKSAPYRDVRYALLLKTKGVYMEGAPNEANDMAPASKELCAALLEKDLPVPRDSLFRDDCFKSTCRKLLGRNEAKIMQDVSRLLVPSAETFFTLGAKQLEHVIESVIEGKDTKYYRHPIRSFYFTTLDGQDKWQAYRFTKNVYDVWMPSHIKMICSAIDQLPSDIDFGVDPLPEETGLSQGRKSLSAATSSQSPLGSTERPIVTPDSSLRGAGTAKRAKKDSVG